MAERNQRKIADNSDFHPNDPFAELTQIMGFDPRIANIASARAASQDDLGIDLERELLGDLVSDQDLAANRLAPADAVPASAPLGEVSLDDDLGASLEAEMAADKDMWSVSEDRPAEVANAAARAPASHRPPFETAQRPVVNPVQAANWNNQAPVGDDDLSDDLALVDMDFLDLAVDDIVQDDPGDASADAMPALDLERRAPQPAAYAHPVASPAAEPSSLEDELSVLLGANEEKPREAAVGASQAASDDFLDDLDPEWEEPQGGAGQASDFEHDRFAGQVGVQSTDAEPAADPLLSSESAADVFADLDRLAAGSTLPPLRPRPSLATPTLAAAPFAPIASTPPTHHQPETVDLDVEAYPDAEVGYSASPADDAASFDADAPSFDVPDEPIAVVDDLDIPDLDFDEPVAAQSAYDDLDLDLPGPAARTEEPANWTPPSAAALDDDFDAYDHELDVRSSESERELRPYEQPETLAPPLAGAAAVAGAAAPPRNWFDNGAPARPTQITSYQSASPVELGDNDFDFEVEEDDQPTFAEKVAATTRIGRRATSHGGRGLLIAGLLAGVAVLGGIGLLFTTFGGGEAEAPTIVRADPEPVKVKPENPGGTVVPNQDNPVYDRVGGVAADQTPTQETLISGAEEPVDVAAQSAAPVADAGSLPALDGDAPEGSVTDTATALPGVEIQPRMIDTSKNEDRVDPASTVAEDSSGADTVAVAPRRVKTMIVRPDGTMVPREEPPAAPVAVATAPATATETPAIEPATGTVAPQPAVAPRAAEPAAPAVQQPAPAAPVAAVEPAPAAPEAAPVAAEPAAPRATSVTPARVPVAPARPADQPVQIVGEVAKPQTQTAALEPAAPAPAAAASGAWTMQIASESSEDGAQNAWRNMSRRYASVLGDRNATIVKADIAGKGTFYRVRVPAGSRNEAIQLCERLKSAGGNCFVSR